MGNALLLGSHQAPSYLFRLSSASPTGGARVCRERRLNVVGRCRIVEGKLPDPKVGLRFVLRRAILAAATEVGFEG